MVHTLVLQALSGSNIVVTVGIPLLRVGSMMSLVTPLMLELEFELSMKDDSLGMNSPIMWLHGDTGRGMQSLNFQGLRVNQWMQPRLDAAFIMGFQTDMHQAMAASSLGFWFFLKCCFHSCYSVMH